MKIRLVLLGALLLTAPGLPAALGAAAATKVTSDLVPPARRQIIVETAERLSRPPAPAPLPADLPQPFNPTGFDQPDPADQPKPVPTPVGQPVGPVAPGQQPAPPAGDRGILEALAAKIPSTGTIMMGGRPLLIVGKNRIEIGQDFVVTYNNQDYELKLVSIDRTTFTLRMRGEEITRPIKLAK